MAQQAASNAAGTAAIADDEIEANAATEIVKNAFIIFSILKFDWKKIFQTCSLLSFGGGVGGAVFHSGPSKPTKPMNLMLLGTAALANEAVSARGTAQRMAQAILQSAPSSSGQQPPSTSLGAWAQVSS